MQILRDLPIRRKLLWVTLTTCGTALALACTALFWFQSVNFRRSFAAELETLGAVIAQNSAAPLAFDDKISAVEVLSALKVKAHITTASVFDSHGKLFARFGTEADPGPAPAAKLIGQVTFDRGYAQLSLPIAMQDAAPGRLQLSARFQDEYHKLLSLYGVVLTAVLAGSLVVIFFMSSIMQGIITGPVAVLAEVARNVSENEDYATRAPESGNDEVGLLTRTFNEMLHQIQARDRRLRESQQRYEVAVMGSSDGLWDQDLVSRAVYYSPRWKGMLGYDDAELPNSSETLRALVHPDDVKRLLDRMEDYLAGGAATFEVEFRARHRSGEYRWILSRGAALRNDLGKPVRFAGSHTDITERKLATEQISRMQRELVAASREAGMAEVATGVLHNVGNVLNSVNVSAGLIRNTLHTSELSQLDRLIGLVELHRDELPRFLTEDARGRQVFPFLQQLATQLGVEHARLDTESAALAKNIEHIKEIVAMQQSFARTAAVLEQVTAADVMSHALQIHQASIARHGFRLRRDFAGDLPTFTTDRHNVLQILTNFVANAIHAAKPNPREHREIIVRIATRAPANVAFSVTDNGLGIEPENLPRIFRLGFTTRKEGHGFGLHAGALAAKSLGGSIEVHSTGPGTGATFTLVLPLQPAGHGS